MEIFETTYEAYGLATRQNPLSVFNTAEFNRLNASRADSLRWLLIGENPSRPLLGIVLGEKDGALRSPFSAPFGGLTPAGRTEPQIDTVYDAVGALKAYAAANRTKIFLTIPSPIYSPRFVPSEEAALLAHGELLYADINYHFDLRDFPSYRSLLSDSARNHLNRSLRNGLSMVRLDSDSRRDVARAYSVIETNRRERGFPLRMSLEQVWETTRLVRAEFFVVTDSAGRDIAAAQMFHVAGGIAQVVYWGNTEEGAELYPMNFLAFKLFEHCLAEGVSLVDIGPSSSEGVPNFGLCQFKKSIGCRQSLRLSFAL
ncbi:MAG: GNAT family N-acetyltransferase [Clostridium sp.]|nr:GNAT family N-acetyltransferase [Clostridium sp.]